jgi:cell division transport system permease protein
VMSHLASRLPGVDVQPIPEYTAAEAQLADKIRLLVGATVGLILALTILGVLAAMAALATERRHDVGVMKAIGGPTPRIIRLFLAEVGLLAVGGALAGCALGLPLSSWISRHVFGTGTTPQWEVVPLVAALMFAAALAGALPLRFLGRVRPAVILRGEGWSL